MRIAYGARVSLLVGVLATAIATIFGVVVGLFAATTAAGSTASSRGSWTSSCRFPYVLFAIVLVSVFGPSLPLIIL